MKKILTFTLVLSLVLTSAFAGNSAMAAKKKKSAKKLNKVIRQIKKAQAKYKYTIIYNAGKGAFYNKKGQQRKTITVHATYNGFKNAKYHLPSGWTPKKSLYTLGSEKDFKSKPKGTKKTITLKWEKVLPNAYVDFNKSSSKIVITNATIFAQDCFKVQAHYRFKNKNGKTVKEDSDTFPVYDDEAIHLKAQDSYKNIQITVIAKDSFNHEIRRTKTFSLKKSFKNKKVS